MVSFKLVMHDFFNLNLFFLSPEQEPSVLRGAFEGHTDSVWGLVYSSAHQRLLSAAADGTIRVWNALEASPALTIFNDNLGNLKICRLFLFSRLNQCLFLL